MVYRRNEMVKIKIHNVHVNAGGCIEITEEPEKKEE